MTTEPLADPTVRLTRDQRDGLHEFVVGELQGDGLSHAVRDGNRERVEILLTRFAVCARVLDTIGWERLGASDAYELEVDPDVRWLMGEIKPKVRGCICDDRLTEDSELLDRDLSALAALELVQEAA